MQPRPKWFVYGVVYLCFAASGAAQPEQLWARQFGTNLHDEALALAPDGGGGTFVCGFTLGDLAAPGAGEEDAFIARHDKSGNALWLRQLGGAGPDYLLALASDGQGGVFVAGATLNDLGGPNAGGSDAFLARYTGAGDRLWIVQFGSDDEDYALALTPDGTGGVIVAGLTAGEIVHTSGGTDAFLARYSGAGKQQWVTQFGTKVDDEAYSLAPDGSGGVFIAGGTFGSLGGKNAGDGDAFVARFDGDAGPLWIEQVGSIAWDWAYAAAPDTAGGVYIAINTMGSLADPNAGAQDFCLARYTASGDRLWLVQSGTGQWDEAYALAADGAGGVYIAGETEGELGGPNGGGSDGFIADYDDAGQRAWAAQIGTHADDYAYAITVSAGDAVCAGGTYGDLGGPNGGEQDAYIARFGYSCYADYNADGTLDLFDFLAFVNSFNAAEPRADCTDDGAFDLFDFLCFVNAFNAGCP